MNFSSAGLPLLYSAVLVCLSGPCNAGSSATFVAVVFCRFREEETCNKPRYTAVHCTVLCRAVRCFWRLQPLLQLLLCWILCRGTDSSFSHSADIWTSSHFDPVFTTESWPEDLLIPLLDWYMSIIFKNFTPINSNWSFRLDLYWEEYLKCEAAVPRIPSHLTKVLQSLACWHKSNVK